MLWHCMKRLYIFDRKTSESFEETISQIIWDLIVNFSLDYVVFLYFVVLNLVLENFNGGQLSKLEARSS